MPLSGVTYLNKKINTKKGNPFTSSVLQNVTFFEDL